MKILVSFFCEEPYIYELKLKRSVETVLYKFRTEWPGGKNTRFGVKIFGFMSGYIIDSLWL